MSNEQGPYLAGFMKFEMCETSEATAMDALSLMPSLADVTISKDDRVSFPVWQYRIIRNALGELNTLRALVEEGNVALNATNDDLKRAEAELGDARVKIAALEAEIKAKLATEHGYECEKCGHHYTPAEGDNEDCPKCGYDGAPAKEKLS
jgi:hypothetical protein